MIGAIAPFAIFYTGIIDLICARLWYGGSLPTSRRRRLRQPSEW